MDTVYPNRKPYASNFVSNLQTSKNFRIGNNLPMKNRIREIRKRNDLSIQKLADKVGVAKGTISKLEKGDMELTADYMQRIADALNCDWVELLRDTPEHEAAILNTYRGFNDDQKREFISYANFLKSKAPQIPDNISYIDAAEQFVENEAIDMHIKLDQHKRAIAVEMVSKWLKEIGYKPGDPLPTAGKATTQTILELIKIN